MHVLSSCDIMVAQVVFCQNLCRWLFIKHENVLKSFWWLKDTAETCCPCLFPIFTMIFVILANCHKTENWLLIKHYRSVLQRRWDNWILPFRYGVLLTFLRLNITRITLWNNFSGLCIKFRNKTWRQIRYLGQNITTRCQIWCTIESHRDPISKVLSEW